MPAVILFLAFVSANFLSPFLILRKIWTQSFCEILRTIRPLWSELSDIYMVDCLEAGGLVCISLFPLLSLPQTFYSAFDYHVLIVYGMRSRVMTFHVRSAYMVKFSLLLSPSSPSPRLPPLHPLLISGLLIVYIQVILFWLSCMRKSTKFLSFCTDYYFVPILIFLSCLGAIQTVSLCCVDYPPLPLAFVSRSRPW